MFEKNGKYFADWRDRKGRRLRKSFNSERAALLHEAAMKEAAHPKPKARGKQSPAFSARSTSKAARQTQTKLSSSRPSSARQARNKRQN